MVECVACGGSGKKSRPTPGGDPKCKPCGGTGTLQIQPDIAQHSSKSVEHYTPVPVVDAARAVLGDIDLDPASCALANEVVKATAWYGPGSEFGEDGLAEPWMGRVFLNPPGGRVPEEWQGMGTSSNATLWWGRLAASWQAGEVEAAIFVGFTLEILRSAQALDVPQPIDFPICVPSSRIRFDTTKDGERVSSSSPTHGNVIVYLPPIAGDRNTYLSALCEDYSTRGRFPGEFGKIGRCRL